MPTRNDYRRRALGLLAATALAAGTEWVAATAGAATTEGVTATAEAATTAGAATTEGVTATAGAPSSEPGAWQTHELEFQFLGFTTTYSCEGLESKLRLLLGRLGARPGYSVHTYGCARGAGMPDRFARARLSFATLAPTPLGAAPATGGAPGSWKSVAFAPNRPFELDSGDCELIEQFRDQLLPLFKTRAVQNQVRCVPHQSPASFSLRFEVFAPPGKA